MPIRHRKTFLLDFLFNKILGLQTCNFIKKQLQQKCFSVDVANILRTTFSIELFLFLVAAFMSSRKGRRAKRRKNEQGKNVQMKEESENISFNFYLQVLVIVKIKMQIQLCKYQKSSPFFSYFFFKFSFFWCSFFVFSFLTK